MISLKTDGQLLEDLGVRIQNHRLLANISQDDLALKSGVSVSTIKKAESGGGCSVLNLIRLMRALGRVKDLEFILPEMPLKPTDMLKMERSIKKNKRLRATKKVAK